MLYFFFYHLLNAKCICVQLLSRLSAKMQYIIYFIKIFYYYIFTTCGIHIYISYYLFFICKSKRKHVHPILTILKIYCFCFAICHIIKSGKLDYWASQSLPLEPDSFLCGYQIVAKHKAFFTFCNIILP